MSKRAPHNGPICGAKTKTPGRYGDWKCHVAPMPNGKCYRHGGNTPVGIASPHFKTGAHSKLLKHLPPTMAPFFEPENPKLIELREELALVDAGVIELLGRIREGEEKSPKYAVLRKALETFKRAWDLNDTKTMTTTLEQMDVLITSGAELADARGGMWELVDRRARLVAVESRRLKDEHEMVAKDDFGRFARHVLMSVATHVLDATTRGKIQADVFRMLALSQVAIATEVAS